MSGQQGSAAVTLLLCSTCAGDPDTDREADRAAIAASLAVRGLAGRVRFSEVACMGACEVPVSLGLQGEGMASYVFAGLALSEDADDIARTCEAYLNSPSGWIEDARPCGRLRLCLRARLPAPGA